MPLKITKWIGKKLLSRGVKMILGKQMTEAEDAATNWEAILGQFVKRTADKPWNTYNTAEKLEEVKRGVVYACIKTLAVAVQEAFLEVGEETDEGFIIEDHEMLRVIKYPNEWFTFEQLIEFIVFNLCGTGEAYLWEIRNDLYNQTARRKWIAELWPLPSSWITPKTTGNLENPYEYFSLNLGKGEQVKIPPEDMTFLRFPDPANPWRGLAPLDAALRNVQSDEERENYIVSMMSNLQVPGGIMYAPTEMDEPKKQELKAAIQESIGGSRRGGTLLAVGENVRFEMQAPLKDLDWKGVSGLDESRICSIFGVPPAVVGVRVGIESTPLSSGSLDGVMKRFYSATILPFWKALAGGLTRGILTNEGESESLVFRFNTNAIAYLQEDRETTAKIAVQLLSASAITRNEARKLAGQEPDKKRGDVYLLPMGIQEIPADTTSTLPPLLPPMTPELHEEGIELVTEEVEEPAEIPEDESLETEPAEGETEKGGNNGATIHFKITDPVITKRL